MQKLKGLANPDKSPRFNFYSFKDKKIRETILQRRSHSFVIGYEILKHYQSQRRNREDRLNKKSFHDQKLGPEAPPGEASSKPASPERLCEDELKLTKDYDSKQLSGSSRAIEPLELGQERVQRKIRVSKNEQMLAPPGPEKQRYSQMLHFSALRKVGPRLEELKALHRRYFLVNQSASGSVD